MIKLETKISYSVNKETGDKLTVNEAAFQSEVIFQKWWSTGADFIECERNSHALYETKEATATNFKNNGHISKTNSHDNGGLIDQLLEAEFHKRLELAKSTKADENRCRTLAKTIDKANWDVDDSDLAVIKVKESHSSWYSQSGVFNCPSIYLTVVPVSVAKEAVESMCLRRKHQNDPTFNFFNTGFFCNEIRVADHDNGDDFTDMNINDNNWKDTFNMDYLLKKFS